MSPLPIWRTRPKSLKPSPTFRRNVNDRMACHEESDDQCGFSDRVSDDFDLSFRFSKDNRLKLTQLSLLLIELWLEFRV
ncbi:hypothetical protein CsSME_00024336 [Camellia sinensis var. sinensis]